MANMFAWAEVRDGAFRKVAFETVTAARQAADATGGGEVEALVLGGPGIAQAAEELGRFGASQVHVVEHPGLQHYSPEVAAATAAERIRSGEHRVAFFAASALGRDLAPRVAAGLGAGFAADVSAFEVTDDEVRVRRHVFTGKAVATLKVAGTPAVLSLRPGAIAVAERPVAPRLSSGGPALDPSAARVVVTRVEARGSAKLDLADAPVIVAGGRGLRAPENFRLVEELADAFGNAAVGATRAVTDDGWRDPADQIGQTGRVVSPWLYVAVGISGAIQHLAGMRTSRVIVAINRDRDAPIFKVADYGIVGDLFEVVPRLTEEIRKVVGR